MKKTAAAVIFDMDGVLVDSNPFHKAAYREFCRKRGIRLTDEEFDRKISGRTNKSALAAVFGKKLSPAAVRRYEEEKESLYRRLFADSIRPLAGLKSLLKRLKNAGIPLAIGTSAPRKNVQFVLRKLAIGGYFRTVVDSRGIKNGKPDPEIYLKVSKRLGIAPHRCIVIEDSFPGVESARRAGMKCIAVTTSHSRRELADADRIVADFRSLTPRRILDLLD